MSALAAISAGAIRPDDWNLSLFIHVLAALVMVGALVTAAYFLFAARREGSLELTRYGFRTLLYATLPAFIVMRVTSQWVADKQGLTDSDAAWIGIGFITTDAGALILIGSTIATGLAVRRAGRAEGTAAVGRAPAVAAWLTALLIVAYVVTIWAMTAKPV